MISDDILDLDEAADYLKLGRHSLYKLVQQSRVPALKVGRRWRFRRSVLDDWLRDNSISSLNNVAPVGGFLSSLSALAPAIASTATARASKIATDMLPQSPAKHSVWDNGEVGAQDEQDERPLVLVADDDSGVRAALRAHIERAGFMVHEADTGTSALDQVMLFRATSSSAYSHIFTDLHMPGIGGADLVQQLKQQSPQSVLVVVTGYADDLVRLDLTSSWPIIIIPKPFRGTQVRDALRLIARRLPDERSIVEP